MYFFSEKHGFLDIAYGFFLIIQFILKLYIVIYYCLGQKYRVSFYSILLHRPESGRNKGTFQGFSFSLSVLDSSSGSGNCCKPETGYCYRFGCGTSFCLVPPGIIVLFSSRPYMCCMSLFFFFDRGTGGHCCPERGHIIRSAYITLKNQLNNTLWGGGEGVVGFII